LARDRKKIVVAVPLFCSKTGSKESTKYEKAILLSPTLNMVGLFLRETGCSLLDTRKMVNGYQMNRKSGCRISGIRGTGL
jgi:hypothetical protein